MATHTDNFNRPDAPTLGPDWELRAGDYVLANQRAQSNWSGTSIIQYLPEAASDDHRVSVRMPVNIGGNTGVTGRHSATAETFYMARHSGTAVTLFRCVNAGYTSLHAVAHTRQAGDVLAVECDGATIRALVNDAPLIELTDTAIPSGRRGGLRVVGANVPLDDFTIADLAVAPEPVTGGGALTAAAPSLAGAGAARTTGTASLTAPPATLTGAATVADPTVTLSGVVTAGGQPLAGAEVWTHSPITGVWTAAPLTGADGAYSLDVAPGEHIIYIYPNEAGYPNQWIGGGADQSAATVFDLTADTTYDINLSVVVSGTVMIGTSPLAGAVVWTHSPVTGVWTEAAPTGADGFYSLTVAPGEHIVYVYPNEPGYPDRWVGGPDQASATVFDLTGDTTVNIQLAEEAVGGGSLVAPTGSLSGAGTLTTGGGGALTAAAATVSGGGDVIPVAGGTGSLVGPPATLVGTGTLTLGGDGALLPAVATLVGVGQIVGVVGGDGALAPSPATLAGDGTLTFHGDGALTAAAGLLEGAGHVSSPPVGDGALTAQRATLSGAGTLTASGAGGLFAAVATIAGTGTALDLGALRDADVTAILAPQRRWDTDVGAPDEWVTTLGRRRWTAHLGEQP